MSAPEPRDIIANVLDLWGVEPHRRPDVIIERLTAAGWTLAPPGSRVVPEGGVDAKTVRICASLIENMRLQPKCDGVIVQAAAALRALAEAKP